ncbi:MAG: restriction endonuclease subunit S [Methylococcaceae bacterium]|jgi:type I restriction enzyme, S subunit
MNAIQTLITEHIDIWTAADTAKKSGRGRSSGNAASVYGIKKLRELILELAVRGKLVPQDENDEPASELLKRIQAEKAKLIAEGKIKKSKSLSEINDDEKLFAIPRNWARANFGEIYSLEYGDNLPSGKRSNSGEYPVYGSNGVVGSHHVCFVSSPCIVVGRKGSAGALNLSSSTGCCVTDVAYYCIPPKHLDLIFSFKLFHTLGLNSLGKGIKPGLNRNEAYDLPVAIPPLAEQHRIVAKVDELMALCDQLENQHSNADVAHEKLVSYLLGTLTQSQSAEDFNTNWQRIAAHFDTLFTTETSIDALKQTLLQLAVMGKLVPQDPNDEPASELLKRIQAEKAKLIAEGKIKKSKPLAAITEEEKPFDLPLGWQWAHFPELGEFGRGKSKHRPRNDPKLFNPGIYPLVQTGEVARAINVISEYHSKYSDVGLAQSKMWPVGTLCITIAANIADSALLGFDACFPDSVVGFVPCDPLNDTKYLLAFMKTARENLLKFAPATAQKNINLEILESVLIPLPPLKEISRIVAKVDELMAICDQLKSRLTAANQLQQKLADVLVEQATA